MKPAKCYEEMKAKGLSPEQKPQEMKRLGRRELAKALTSVCSRVVQFLLDFPERDK